MQLWKKSHTLPREMFLRSRTRGNFTPKIRDSGKTYWLDFPWIVQLGKILKNSSQGNVLQNQEWVGEFPKKSSQGRNSCWIFPVKCWQGNSQKTPARDILCRTRNRGGKFPKNPFPERGGFSWEYAGGGKFPKTLCKEFFVG